MDGSSNSQQPSQSQIPASASDPPASSSSGYDGSGSNSGTPSGSGGFAGESSPSVRNYSQEEVDVGEQPDNKEDDDDVDVAADSTKPQPNSSAPGKEKMADTTTGAAASSSGTANREGNALEIRLLKDLLNLHNRTGRYLETAGSTGEPDFYKFWIQEERVYANRQELDNKIGELHARYLKNMDKKVPGPIDPIDEQIFQFSALIWGDEFKWFEQETTTDDGEQDSDQKQEQEADEVNVVKDGGDDGVNPPDDDDDDDSSPRAKKAKTDNHGADQVDLKDSTKESGPSKKD